MSADDDYAEDLRDWYAEDERRFTESSQARGHLGMAIKLAEQFSGRLLFVNKRRLAPLGLHTLGPRR